jgi:predicted butyrate kinase (DUF1464 family)
MITPFPLYVDEISADQVKATVSDAGTVFHNIRTLLLDMPFPAPGPTHRHTLADRFGKKVNGVVIMPAGRFVCMLAGTTGKRGMIILDLVDKEELAYQMAIRLDHVDLQDRFMLVYEDVVQHPEKHHRFQWVIGKPKWP